jgi:hypothetical protein
MATRAGTGLRRQTRARGEVTIPIPVGESKIPVHTHTRRLYLPRDNSYTHFCFVHETIHSLLRRT